MKIEKLQARKLLIVPSYLIHIPIYFTLNNSSIFKYNEFALEIFTYENTIVNFVNTVIISTNFYIDTIRATNI